MLIAAWAPKNALKFFFLIEVFENPSIFHHFDTSINTTETLKVSRNFGFQV